MSFNHIIQLTLVIIIVAVAVAVAVRSIYRALHCKKSALNGCAGCPLATRCSKKS